MTEIRVPDIGEEKAEIIEILVKKGDSINLEDPLIVLESDKASMEIPADKAGVIDKLLVKVGDKVGTNDLILELNEVNKNSKEEQTITKNTEAKEDYNHYSNSKKAEVVKKIFEIKVPDIGEEKAEIIEILVKKGDSINLEDPLIVLESDKASMEIPANKAGVIDKLLVKIGDKVGTNDIILKVESVNQKQIIEEEKKIEEFNNIENVSQNKKVANNKSNEAINKTVPTSDTNNKLIHAGPAVRMVARELNINLELITPTGRKNRILKEDLINYLKNNSSNSNQNFTNLKTSIPDFSKFGEFEIVVMDKIKTLTAQNMHNNWLTVPHVTQFDRIDITELESFRKSLKKEMEKKEIKLTLISFIIKACAILLNEYPIFNTSVDMDKLHIVYKKYINIGFAVDTEHGLLVPVIKDTDKKSVWQIADEVIKLASKAKKGSLTLTEMQGGCFTVSSLGGIGGDYFTPIVNSPEVAILGIGKSSIQPTYKDNKIEPSLILPLSLSYDHRAINGSDGAKFITNLRNILENFSILSLY